MSTNSEAIFPAIRARLGDWWYYLSTLTLRDIAERVGKVEEIHETKELKTWIQRQLVPERLEDIAHYIHSQPQHFFNALVLGIYGGDPEWFPVKVTDNLAVPSTQLDERTSTAFGLIKLSGTEEIFAIDGQHRVEGIKLALSTDRGGKLGNEEQSVILVSHKVSQQGRERTRRLFSTLNKYAKPVSKGEIIALSEDDTFAVVTRKLVDEYHGLRSDFVPLLKTPNLKANDPKSITSVISLYEVIRIISLPPRSREKKQLVVGPPHPEKVKELFDLSVAFWDALQRYFPEIRKVCESNPSEALAGRYRHDEGGHLLFRPAGLTAFARAARVLMDRGVTVADAVKILHRVPTEIAQEPWKQVIWDPARKTMLLKNMTLVKNLLLARANQAFDPETYNLDQEYQNTLGGVRE
jgi:DNA sulfur modification protein DndB